MRFSLLFEHQLPRPWAPGAEHRRLQEAIEQVVLADRLGYATAWAGGHHFLEEHAHSSAPEVFLAACSQLTRTIRLGLGPLPLAPAFQHPARVAEAAATLDLVSGGRVELATTDTTTAAENGAIGAEADTRRAQVAAGLTTVARMLTETPFAGADGPHLAMPPRNVVPKPLQTPHPPLWAACARRDAVRDAGERGLGALGTTFLEPDQARTWVEEHRAAIASERCVPAGAAVNARVAVPLPMHVHADEAEAIARGIDGAHFFAYALGHYTGFGEHRPGRTDLWAEFTARRDEVGFARSIITADGAPLDVKVLKNGLASLRGAIGTPGQVRDLLRRYEEAGVDEVVLCVQTGRTAHAHVLEALELFAREILPAFAQPSESTSGDLDAAVQRALRRRPAPPEVPEDYTFGPGEPAAAPEPAPGPPARGPSRVSESLRRAAEAQGERALRAFVKRTGDRGLERTVGSNTGLRVLFGAMERQFDPERAGDFNGDIQYNLRGDDGAVASWVVGIAGGAARAREGAAADPRLTLTLSRPDFARIAAGELDPVKAVLTGRLELAGDFAVAMRLGEMFGRPPAI